MSAVLVENNGNMQKSYDSIVVDPKNIGILRNSLAMKVISELAAQPCCAFDIARKLGQHEQKIYYHLRNLEKAGIIKIARTEKRYGMTAKIYKVVSPVVSAKLYEGGRTVENKTAAPNPKMEEFLRPFIEDGKLNAKIIAGYPYPHGKYDSGARATVHGIDFFLMLGKFLNNFEFPHYRLDIETKEENLKENLILLSNPKANTIVEKINGLLPVYFDPWESWDIKSKITGNVYKEASMGVILKWDNPFNKNKKILLLAGKRTRGMRAVVIALTRHLNEVMKAAREDGNVVRVVEGLDRKGDGIIDSVKFLE